MYLYNCGVVASSYVQQRNCLSVDYWFRELVVKIYFVGTLHRHGLHFLTDFDWNLAGQGQDTERENSSEVDGIDLSSAMANARENLAAGVY